MYNIGRKAGGSVMVENNDKINLYRYGKPIMTNLPEDLGRSIFKTIMNTKPYDYKKRRQEADAIEARITAARKKEDDD